MEVIFEFFAPPPIEVLELLRKAGKRVYLQISPEPHDEEIRCYGRPYTNHELKTFLRNAKQLGFERVDVYFMIGVTRPDGRKRNGSFFEELWQEAPNIVDAFVAPLAPFMDPGSLAFYKSAEYGYKLYAYTLTEHRELLLAKNWYEMLGEQAVFHCVSQQPHVDSVQQRREIHIAGWSFCAQEPRAGDPAVVILMLWQRLSIKCVSRRFFVVEGLISFYNHTVLNVCFVCYSADSADVGQGVE